MCPTTASRSAIPRVWSRSARESATRTRPVPCSARRASREPPLVCREERGFERAHLGERRIAEVRNAEDVLDRSQQREVVVGSLADGPALDEPREQQRAHLPAAVAPEERCFARGRRQVREARLPA